MVTATDLPDSRLKGLDTALILHVRAYRETSLMVDLVAEQHGRLRLIAKGAKRGRGAIARQLRPFELAQVSWSGRSDLKVLSAFEPLDTPLGLQGTGLFLGFYVSELLIRMLPLEDPNPELFRTARAALAALGRGEDPEWTLRCFEMDFLEGIGYGLNYEMDSEGCPIDPLKTYDYHPEVGAIQRDGGQAYLGGDTLLALGARSPLTERQRHEAKRLMRMVLSFHMNGRPLRSRELFKQIAKGPFERAQDHFEGE